MAKFIKSITIKNFRGIKEKTIEFSDLNMFIGNNGTNKTAILEALNYVFSPFLLTGKIKPTDFYKGTDDPIEIIVEFEKNFKVYLPDGYDKQKVDCNKINLTIKKRERKSPRKLLSDLVSIDHYVVPTSEVQINNNGTKYWEIKRESNTTFKFSKNLLSFSVFESDEIPRLFYFNKERNMQIYKGLNTYFSSIIDDLNWRFAKKQKATRKSVNDAIEKTEKEIYNSIKIDSHVVIKKLNENINKFNLDLLNLSFIDKSAPFDQAFLSKNEGKVNLQVKNLGSGIEMMYTLLFLDTLASLSKENLIILIDEPELHLHPKLQEKFAHYLFDLSNTEKYQIFITTHSPIFFKNLVYKKNVFSVVTRVSNDGFEIYEYSKEHKQSILPWGPTWGEINFLAYDYPTIEFHNELYGYLQEITNKKRCNDLDDFLSNKFLIPKDKKWIPEKNGKALPEENVTLMTFIRHKIHHPENKTMQSYNFNDKELKKSIKDMIDVINKIKN